MKLFAKLAPVFLIAMYSSSASALTITTADIELPEGPWSILNSTYTGTANSDNTTYTTTAFGHVSDFFTGPFLSSYNHIVNIDGQEYGVVLMKLKSNTQNLNLLEIMTALGLGELSAFTNTAEDAPLRETIRHNDATHSIAIVLDKLPATSSQAQPHVETTEPTR